MYAKVYASLWEGSLSGTGFVWAVFVFLLARCDREGYVDIHPRVISQLTGFSEEDVREALRRLEAADPDSKTPDMAGARLELLEAHRDWGWRIVNYPKYRQAIDADTVREQTRERVRRYRSGNGGNGDGNVQKRHADVEADVEAYKSNTPLPPSRGSARVRKRVRVQTLGLPVTDADWAGSFSEHLWPEYLRLKPTSSRAAAWVMWCRIPHPDGQADFDKLWAALQSYSAERSGEDPKFTKDASTWLNDYHRNLLLPVAP